MLRIAAIFAAPIAQNTTGSDRPLIEKRKDAIVQKIRGDD
jgi:hypothetical protein